MEIRVKNKKAKILFDKNKNSLDCEGGSTCQTPDVVPDDCSSGNDWQVSPCSDPEVGVGWSKYTC